MIKKRPTLPLGHALAGLPPVSGNLFSDERFELYSLISSSSRHSHLFLVKGDDSPEAIRRLSGWWAIQPTLVLAVIKILTPEELLPNLSGAVLELQGSTIESLDLVDAKEEYLRRLFSAMIDLVSQGQVVNMRPDFDPSQTRLSEEGSAICTLLPLDDPPASESELVRFVASSFYQFATGIDIGQVSDGKPQLHRWAKYSGEKLSRIIERCLAPPFAKFAINSLADLNQALGLENVGLINPPNSTTSEHITQSSSAQARGLDKVAGMHDLKSLLRREVVDPLRNPEPYRRYGLSVPKGILLFGPPGCGKTYIARQLAEELGHYFVEIIPSEIASPYIHQSVLRIREVFEIAAEQAPAVLFIDEFEALVPPRGELGGQQHYKAEEVNEFLAHLNNCSEKRIFVIAASNQPEKIDPAVRRTGRLDKLVYVGPPDLEARREMLALHLHGRPVAADLDLGTLAETLTGYSASDIRFLVDEAARDAFFTELEISSTSFSSAMTRLQPSVTPEIEELYKSIEKRGF